MCYVNAEEVSLSMSEWNALFPDGFPACYTDTDGMIDIEAYLPNIAKALVNDFKRWATSRNAERAQRLDSCRITGVFPLLDALKRAHSEVVNAPDCQSGGPGSIPGGPDQITGGLHARST